MTEAGAPPAGEAEEDRGGLTRRAWLAGVAGALGAAALGDAGLPAQSDPPRVRPASGAPGRVPGAPTSPVGHRSPFVHPVRSPTGAVAGSSNTPLQDLAGTITPADLHFEVHHAGVPAIDPGTHELLVHGLVTRPTVFTPADLQRLPRVTRVHFIECAGNGVRAWGGNAFGMPDPGLTPQEVAGMVSNSEWTGVPVRVLLEEAGIERGATWMLAEGGDACLMARSIPVEKALDDAMVAWAQNGEPLRPEQGYPMRLVLPGWEGNTNVKWLRRLELGTRPWMTRWETATYTDPLPNGTARQFSFVMDAKSIITSPAHPEQLAPGACVITGLAWSGRGAVRRVEVSVDAGATWQDAALETPVRPRAHVRFTFPWRWTGGEAVILSRASDETGYVQPTRRQLIDVRGPGTLYHYNPIYGWRIMPNGRVFFHGAT